MFPMVIRCKNPKCDFVKDLGDQQELVASLQLQEWGMLKTTRCNDCDKLGTLKVETMSGIPVTSDFGDDFVVFKNEG